MMRVLAAALLLLAACDREPDPGVTPEYSDFLKEQFKRRMLATSSGPTGTAVVHPVEGRAVPDGAFCELFVNGVKLERFPAATGREFDRVGLRTGPNWIALWDSSLNRATKAQVDTRQGTRIVVAGDGAGGWAILLE